VKGYTITTERPTHGPWHETLSGDRFATARLDDGRVFHVCIQRNRRVRIPYKPRGTFGWTYTGTVRDAAGKVLVADRVAGSLGVRGLLRLAYLLEPEKPSIPPGA
jgi:hypothetical protein